MYTLQATEFFDLTSTCARPFPSPTYLHIW